MCRAIEDMINDVKKQELLKIAWRLLTMGFLTQEQIAQATDLTLEEVQELAKEVQTPV